MIGFIPTEPLVVIVVAIVVLAIIAARFLLRDPDVRRTRFGFFVERDRYGEEEEEPDESSWPYEDTRVIPPKEEP